MSDGKVLPMTRKWEVKITLRPDGSMQVSGFPDNHEAAIQLMHSAAFLVSKHFLDQERQRAQAENPMILTGCQLPEQMPENIKKLLKPH